MLHIWTEHRQGEFNLLLRPNLIFYRWVSFLAGFWAELFKDTNLQIHVVEKYKLHQIC